MASGFGSDTIAGMAGRIAGMSPAAVRFGWNSGRLNGAGHIGFAGDVLQLQGRTGGDGDGLVVDLRATRGQVLGWQRLSARRIGLRLRGAAGSGQEGLRTLEFSHDADADRLVAWLPGTGTRSSLIRRWYEDRLGPYRRQALATYAIAAVIVVCFILQVLRAGGLSFDAATLYAHGANLPMQTLAGEPWRMLSAVFLHGDFGHLLGNLITFLALAPYVERLYGRPALVAIFLGAGLVGSAADIFSHFSTVAVGASGAVFGVVGALFAYPLRRPGQLPLASMRVILAVGGLYMIWSLEQGFDGEGVNNSAHISGLIAGFALGLVLAPPFEIERRSPMLPLAAVGALGAVVLGCGLAFAAGRGSDDYRLARLMESIQARAKDIDSACQSAQKVAQADPAAGQAGFEAACVSGLDAIEQQVRGLAPSDEGLRSLVAEQLAQIARRREANQVAARVFADIARIKPADAARIAALDACDVALDALESQSRAVVGRRLREECLDPLDRAIDMLDGATAQSPDELRFRQRSRSLWQTERDSLARIERAVLGNDGAAIDAAVDALNAARAAHAAGQDAPAAVDADSHKR
jgi:membrane associated rhomboid family serine protease